VIDTATRKILHKIEFEVQGIRKETLQPVGISLTPDAKTAFIALGPANRVAVVDMESFAVKDYLLVGQRVWQLAMTPDAKYVLSANGESNDVSVIDVASLKVIKSIPWASCPGASRSSNADQVISRERIMRLGMAVFAMMLVAAAGTAYAAKGTRFWNLTHAEIDSLQLAPVGSADYGENLCLQDDDKSVEADERLQVSGVKSGTYDAKIHDVTAAPVRPRTSRSRRARCSRSRRRNSSTARTDGSFLFVIVREGGPSTSCLPGRSTARIGKDAFPDANSWDGRPSRGLSACLARYRINLARHPKAWPWGPRVSIATPNQLRQTRGCQGLALA
jgi:YVTN family beta-propeller protein